MIRVAVDAMGGDHGPDVIVEGVVEALRESPVRAILVGDEARVANALKRCGAPSDGIDIVHASEVVAMGAHPVEAVKRQKDSSIVVACRLVKEGRADAVVSAGSTGAAMASSLLQWGRVKGIERPAIGTVLPSLSGRCLLLDAGAQVDCRPKHLTQFAIMGSIYAERVLGLERPRVGLLNIGEEETKGNDLVLSAYAQLKEVKNLNFIGNVEGRDILPGRVDVAVCDGFVGNIVLKFAEGMAAAVFDLLRESIDCDARSRLGGLLLKPSLRRLWKRMDYAEYGGAPLLGVRGVSIISHGSSSAKAIRNAVRVAREAVSAQMVKAIEEQIMHTEGDSE